MVIKSEAVSSSHGRKLRSRTTNRLSPRTFGSEHVAGGECPFFGWRSRGGDLNASRETSSGKAKILALVASLFHHLGARFPEEDTSSIKEEAKELSRQLSEEKNRRIAQGMELRDLQAKIKAIEGAVETSSSEALALGRRNQEHEEALEKLRTEIKASEDVKVMAVNGEKITS
ncbi:unnamed protein product [Eruca vesicaria subsp. sativa]|uniref:Uncharacterized protein n=1 Tax=Eruca vesicaria subsp. sativa TaxID=29727 RepID=A0ABC8LQZ8_ERUVS|nr:unnamed protein product [Eruca vesicaria subsp. sativa]